MVPSSVLTVATDGEHLWCDGFSIGETIHFGSLEFITDRFGDLSILLMAKFGKSEKPDCPISYFRPSGFGSFRVKLRNELKLKI
jgi:hypothetical protein